MKKNSIQFKIGFIMILAVILLSATCYLLYRNLASIVSSIKLDANPEMRLLSIRDISMDLEKAGNSVRMFTITRNPSDIKPYYKVIANIDEKVSQLRSECKNDSVLMMQTDTISRLIERNIYIWNELLVLYKDDQVIEYLKQLSDQLAVASEGSSQKKGILSRVFGRRTEEAMDEGAVKSDLDSLVQENQLTKEELISRESKLAVTSSEIKEKFYDLISKMENEIYRFIDAKAMNAGKIASQTYKLLVMLSISGGLLAILVLYIIIRYTRNAYTYQVELEKAKNEAEKLAKTKELFMANMSHEIRTPVTAISGFTDQLIHETHDENSVRSLQIIKSSSDHLIKIIDDILDFSKLQNDKIELEKVHFSIHQLLDEIFILFFSKAKDNNINLSYSISPDTPPVLLGDPFRLKQIMLNLVSNAVKFTKNGSVIFEVISKAKDWGAIELIFSVKDTGIGVDESKIEAIFEDFTQAEMSTTRKYGGTGLGLSIVRRLVDIHNGTIEFKSRRNQGTEIICRLPYMTGEADNIKKDAGHIVVPAEINKLKILIADDEEYNRMLFRKILERWNLTHQAVINGMDALEVLKENKYDLLFLDLRMPGIDGLKTARFIREELKISESEMPIIAISAAPVNGEWERYRKSGMNAFIPKPFSEEMLLNTILTVMRANERSSIEKTEEHVAINRTNETLINLENLYHISGGDEQFVKQMLTSFVNTTRKGLEDIRQAVDSGRLESVADLAHKLLSPCRHIGAMNLYDNLSRLEKGIRNKADIGPIEVLMGSLLNDFESVSELIGHHLEKMK